MKYNFRSPPSKFQVFVTGSKLLFKGVGSDVWYQTNASMLTKDRLFKLLRFEFFFSLYKMQ